MDRVQKTLGFTKGAQRYDLRYDNVKDLIHALVDYAEDPRYNLDLMDVFILVHRLAFQNTEQEREKKAKPS